MQFLVDIIVYYYNTPVFYKVSRISDNEYFAEPHDHSMSSFILQKNTGTWTSAGFPHKRQVKEVGKRLDLFLGNRVPGNEASAQAI